MKLLKYKNIYSSILLWITPFTFINTINALSECSMSADICTIKKSLKHLNINKYCIDGTKIYLGDNDTGGCNLATEIATTGYYFFKNDEIINNADIDPDSGFYCTKNDNCSKITENGIYINALSPTNVVSYNKQGSSQSIAVATKSAFLTNLETPLLITCDLTNGCNTKISASKNDVYINGLGKGLTKALIVCSSSTECIETTPPENSQYISSTDIDGLITCTDKECTSLDYSLVEPDSYYLNNGNDKDTKQLIFCDSLNSSCSTIKGLYNFYINGSDKKTLIQCKKNSETSETECSVTNSNSNVFYLNAVTSGSLDNALIKCDPTNECSYSTPTKNSYYLNGNASSLSDALIFCDSSTCSAKNAKDDLFYINGDRNVLKNGLIYCTSGNLCKTLNASPDSFYLSGTKDGLNNALIYFDTTSSPNILNGINHSYYLNTPSTNSTNALISCSDDTCSTTKETHDSYYITSTYPNINSSKEVFKTLIYCNTKGSCNNVNAEKNAYYLNRATTELDQSLIHCEVSSTTSTIVCAPLPKSKINSGYYMNAGENFSLYPLITCDDKSCNTLEIVKDILPGYYVNAGDSVNVIIICNDSTCTSTNDFILQKVGGYFYKNSVLNFYYNDINTVANTTIESIDLFYNVKITENNVFPTILSNKETVFKVSKYSITRVAVDGILSIGSDNRLTTNDINLGASSDVYSCSKSTLICSKITSCITNSFYLDPISNVGYYCDSNQLTPITKKGYYIDNGRYVGKNTPYLIYCNLSNICISVDSPRDYYLNAGINYLPKAQSTFTASAKNEKNLIYCNNINCNTIISSDGYYIAGLSSVDTVANRIIYCSGNSCNEPRPISVKSFFINSGIDGSSKPVISCDTEVCNTISVKSGYFITENQNMLISCESSKCKQIKAVIGYYYYGATQSNGKKIIECTSFPATGIECNLIPGQTGYYESTTTNVLIDCTENQCKTLFSKNGLFRSATTRNTSTSNSSKKRRFLKRASSYIYNLIKCNNEECHELSTLELEQIPICSFNDDKCYIELPSSISSTLGQITSISEGNYCTSSDRSQIYFATGEIIIRSDEKNTLFSTESSTKNCLKVSNKYKDNFYVFQNIIYKIRDYSVTQLSDPGYYFIDISNNILASPNDISTYNSLYTRLFKCTEDGCSLIQKPERTSYFTDINKKIIKYDESNEEYTFMKDITCIYSNNKCTPNSNMNGQNVCITYKGELVITSSEIQSHESGACYKSNDIRNDIYAYSQSLYLLNSNSAQLIQNTSYFFINSISHASASYRDVINGKSNSVLIYGCLMSNCNLYEQEEGIYYYNTIDKYLVKYENGVWTTPKKSGYALVSINPNELYIYKISVVGDNVILENKVSEGFYYTIDDEMYECTDHESYCKKISESGYYFTASDEMYYCLYDSEHIEKTVCYKQTCNSGQYYFIEYRYHRCEKNSILHPVSYKYCLRSQKVVINFPTMYKEEFPKVVRRAIDGIELHNNSTSVVRSNSLNMMNVVPGVFTNCTYNAEEDVSNFDLICISNYVEIDKKDAKICSVENFGFVECHKDNNNPLKCKKSFALSIFHFNKWIYIIIIVVTTYLLSN